MGMATILLSCTFQLTLILVTYVSLFNSKTFTILKNCGIFFLTMLYAKQLNVPNNVNEHKKKYLCIYFDHNTCTRA